MALTAKSRSAGRAVEAHDRITVIPTVQKRIEIKILKWKNMCVLKWPRKQQQGRFPRHPDPFNAAGAAKVENITEAPVIYITVTSTHVYSVKMLLQYSTVFGRIDLTIV